MGQSMKEWRDNQVVQGEILHRVESRLDRLELVVEQNSQAMARNTEAIGKVLGGMALLQSAMKGMVQTAEGLSATVARFIRGLQGAGHHPATDKPQ